MPSPERPRNGADREADILKDMKNGVIFHSVFFVRAHT